MSQNDEVNKAYDNFVEERKQQRIKETKDRLRTWQAIRKIEIKKEEARKSHSND